MGDNRIGMVATIRGIRAWESNAANCRRAGRERKWGLPPLWIDCRPWAALSTGGDSRVQIESGRYNMPRLGAVGDHKQNMPLSSRAGVSRAGTGRLRTLARATAPGT